MAITVKEVTTKKDLNTFIYLPEKIHYPHHKNWVHPLYMDDKKFFDSKKNPAFENNTAVLFLAFKDNKAVGRIMGVIPREYNATHEIQTARFSFFETYEDKEVFDALLQAFEDWAKKHECTQLIGPMGFSDKEPQGFLTYGFDEPTMMVTNCSFEYMKNFIEQNNFKPLVELCQYDVPLTDKILDRYRRFTQRVENNLKVHALEFTKINQVRPYIQGVFDLINTTYTDIYGFTKITKAEADEFANRFLPLLNPRLIKLITDENNKVIAFVIAMPNLSPAIRKAKGRLFPFGWYHILKANKTSKRLVLLLGAVQNDMQNKGLDAVLAVKLIGSALNLGFTIMDSHLIMKENRKMRREIERMDNFKLYKEYTIYEKSLK